MIKNIGIALCALIIMACNQSANLKSANPKSLDTKSIVIDVRSSEEFEEGHLKNAVNIPHYLIMEKITTYVEDKNSNIIVYCHSGQRAERAQKKLIENGYINTVNAGSYLELKNKENSSQ